jgi:hypothetical protein
MAFVHWLVLQQQNIVRLCYRNAFRLSTPRRPGWQFKKFPATSLNATAILTVIEPRRRG